MRVRRYALPLLLIGELAFFLPMSGFRLFDYLAQVAVLSAPLIILAMGMTVVLMTAGIDLSIGSMMALVACVMSRFDQGTEFWMQAAPLGFVLALTLGCFNGFLISRLDVPPIIATLGTLFFYRGLCDVVMEGKDNIVPVPAWMGMFPGSPLIAGVLLLIGGCYFFRSRWRRDILMMGGNRIAARYAGIPVDRRIIQVYTLMGLLAFVAALCASARDVSVIASWQTGLELKVIVAVVLGGTRVDGGSGSMVGSVFGVLLITVLEVGLISVMKSDLILILLGPLLVLGVWLNTPSQHGDRPV